MLDPFPAPPAWFVQAVTPFAEAVSLPTLPLHAHEILFAVLFYQSIVSYLSPWLSSRLFPRAYGGLTARTRLNWDVHVVSLVQSVLINALALWIIAVDDERRRMDWRGRVWGYTGAAGLVQGLAAGYFLWDLIITTRHVAIFGWGMWAHAVCALCVFACGFRPFVNYYGPVFILYELSSPFLNIHWFFDKLGMTGSRAQLYNGLVLLVTFFGCRLVWGTLQTYFVFRDVWRALDFQNPYADLVTKISEYDLMGKNGSNADAAAAAALAQSHYGDPGSVRYAGPHVVPLWLALMYLASNTLLGCLNVYWFNKMIEAVRKRFRPTPKSQQQHQQQEEEDDEKQKRKSTEGVNAEEKSKGGEQDGHMLASAHQDDDDGTGTCDGTNEKKVQVKRSQGANAVEVLSSVTAPSQRVDASGGANPSRQRRRYG